jgi:hypothetical protein
MSTVVPSRRASQNSKLKNLVERTGGVGLGRGALLAEWLLWPFEIDVRSIP